MGKTPRKRRKTNQAPNQQRRNHSQAAVEGVMDVPNAAAAIETNVDRAKVLATSIRTAIGRLKGSRLDQRDDADRVKTRLSLIYPADQFGLQRVVGERDILQITFLRQALEAARAVCRLRIRGDTPAPPSFGTGFLVAPGVLVTNHHVLETQTVAHLSLAEFDAELDTNYVECQPRVFNLLPDQLFVTDPALDFTFVAVNSIAQDGRPLSECRTLVLLRESGKGLNGEYATVIQHPGGQTKQIVIRESRIILLPEPERSRVGEDFL